MQARFASSCGRTTGCRVAEGDEVTKLDSGRWGHADPSACVVAPVQGGSTDVIAEPVVRNGLYTVVLDDDSHVTLRIKDAWTNEPDVQQVGYLAGSDNESDYVNFAFVRGHRLAVWKKYRDSHERQQVAIRYLLDNTEQAHACGVRYARESGNCYRCNRTLTDPVSIELGIGPVCRGDA